MPEKSDSSKKEEAAFLSAYSYKLASPVYSLDPTDTNKALEAFQEFINLYPNSDKIEEANKHYFDLNYKLQKKYFEIAIFPTLRVRPSPTLFFLFPAPSYHF